MINFKKSTGKIGKIKKDYGINLDTVINKNLEIDDTDLDGEKVMMNLDKGEYFMMNEVGSRIWEIISEPINVKEIISTLRNEYEVDEETCKDTVIEFLGRLDNADLISIN
ncbi:lasso peptide biosynthesis PqqD family chaperone [Clostridium sp. K04]|uniref:lasso peptide biosynthesis PqqD family chaperone n=1 Tax=Clostridium sp. K04 TaxID=2718929 RepID=UPI001C8CB3FF|nr:lasso peptide biosynthesis PqqD family chaperone [Clostridium sp. K04]MBX9186256.1 lasso peptide biosynthesis PqqD family chaperone [Clostridium sp. K04]